jgi:hypothetical protein
MQHDELLPRAVTLLIGVPAFGACIGIGLWFATANAFK